MPRRFRLRLREGHHIHTYSDEADAPLPSFGPGDEIVVSEHVAANILRHDRSAEVVEIIVDPDADPE